MCVSFYHIAVVVVCLLNVVGFAMHDYEYRIGLEATNVKINDVSLYIRYFCTGFFVADISLELAARRIFQGKNSFFKNPWLILNSISILSR